MSLDSINNPLLIDDSPQLAMLPQSPQVKLPSFAKEHQNQAISLIKKRRHFGSTQFSVSCRVRPLHQNENPLSITINQAQTCIQIEGNKKTEQKIFTFHHIYDEKVTQKEFTDEICSQVLNNFQMNGKGSLVLSYGVTNSGKTFTILGTQSQPGLLPVIIRSLGEKYPQQEVKITAIQAYNDEFYSLKTKQRLYPKQNSGSYQFLEYAPQPITNQSHAQLIATFIANRSQTDSKLNKKSSRSHAIFKIHCGSFTIGIVDLAGSERLNKANTNVQETTAINRSLLTLGRCIHAFKDGQMIPFRQAKLTKALMEYFGSNFKVYMIAHLNREIAMHHQNLKVLEYAALTKKTKPLNAFLNPSIVRSARKRYDQMVKSTISQSQDQTDGEADESVEVKSCIGFKRKNRFESKENHSRDNQSKQNHSKSPNLKKNTQDSQEQEQMPSRIKVINEEYVKYTNKKAKQIYMAQLFATQQEIDRNVDAFLEDQQTSHRQFVSDLQSRPPYVSPVRYPSQEQMIEKMKKIAVEQLRKQIIQQIAEDRKKKLVEYGTAMSTNFKKRMYSRKSVERRQDNIFVEKEKEIEFSISTPLKEQRKMVQAPQVVNQQEPLTEDDVIANNSFIAKLQSPLNMFKQSAKKIYKSACQMIGNLSRSKSKIQKPNEKEKQQNSKQSSFKNIKELTLKGKRESLQYEVKRGKLRIQAYEVLNEVIHKSPTEIQENIFIKLKSQHQKADYCIQTSQQKPNQDKVTIHISPYFKEDNGLVAPIRDDITYPSLHEEFYQKEERHQEKNVEQKRKSIEMIENVKEEAKIEKIEKSETKQKYQRPHTHHYCKSAMRSQDKSPIGKQMEKSPISKQEEKISKPKKVASKINVRKYRSPMKFVMSQRKLRNGKPIE